MTGVNGVAIFNQSYKQVLVTSLPAKASINITSKLPEHPLENGSVINDHKIFNPVEVEVILFLKASEYKTAYAEIKQLYNSSVLLIVQTYTDTYKNMAIMELPHEETGDMVDAFFVSLRFREMRFAPAQYGVLPVSSVQQAADSSTQDRGEQPAQQQSLLSSGFDAAKEFFK